MVITDEMTVLDVQVVSVTDSVGGGSRHSVVTEVEVEGGSVVRLSVKDVDVDSDVIVPNLVSVGFVTQEVEAIVGNLGTSQLRGHVQHQFSRMFVEPSSVLIDTFQ